jgi:hypothetical protein
MKAAVAALHLLIVGLCAGASVQSAHAQAASPQDIEGRLEAAGRRLGEACSMDVRTFCGGITPGGGRLLFCVLAHEDKITPACDVALYNAARGLERALNRIEDVADACWDDIEKRCANVPPGSGRIASCLIGNKASLSPTCRATIDQR